MQDDIKPYTSLALIRELHRRGVTIEQIFGRYFEIEAQADDEYALLTVGDAQLAGLAELPDAPNKRQPF